MRRLGICLAVLCLPLAGCPAPGTAPPQRVYGAHGQVIAVIRPEAPAVAPGFTLQDMADYVDRMSAKPPAARNADIERLQHEGTPSAADQLKLAYLLSLDGSKDEEIAESKRLLDGLDRTVADPGVRLYVRLLARTVALEAAYAHQTARADDLEQKLAQLKKLELDLMRRNQTTPAVPAK